MIKQILTITIYIFTAICIMNNSVVRDPHHIPKTTLENALTKEVTDYINRVSPKSSITPKAIVDKCIEHDIDIIFVLAQGQIESNFGTAGIASITNSVWNVNSHDGRSSQYIIKNGLGYEHPDHSISPYISLIKRQYPTNGRTEQDLMNKFTSSSGHRYASSLAYESQLRSLYNRIHLTTNIKHLQSHLKKIKNSNGNDSIY